MLTTKHPRRRLFWWPLVLLLAAVPAPAVADIKVIDDPVGDSIFVDISQVRLVHRDAVMVRVKSAVPLAPGQVYTFWLDSDGDPAPDYRVAFSANAGFEEELGLVRAFGVRPSRFIQCLGLRARADFSTDKPVSMRIPRRCLENPERVRVAVRFTDESTGSVDWSAGRRTFGPSVER